MNSPSPTLDLSSLRHALVSLQKALVAVIPAKAGIQ
jgi:hypothetical protein